MKIKPKTLANPIKKKKAQEKHMKTNADLQTSIKHQGHTTSHSVFNIHADSADSANSCGFFCPTRTHADASGDCWGACVAIVDWSH